MVVVVVGTVAVVGPESRARSDDADDGDGGGADGDEGEVR